MDSIYRVRMKRLALAPLNFSSIVITKDNRYEMYSMSGGNVHLRGPDAHGNWADLVYDPGLNYALVIGQKGIPRLQPE